MDRFFALSTKRKLHGRVYPAEWLSSLG